MGDHYHGFDHPGLNLSSEPTVALFREMDEIADDLRHDPRYVESDLAIAFRDLQRQRQPDLSKAQVLDLFAVWLDHDRGLQVILDAARTALWDTLINEREALFIARK